MLLVHAHLSALVVRHAQSHRLGNAQQLVRKALQDVGSTGRLELGELDQHDQSAAALNRRSKCTGIALALDQVAPLPSARGTGGLRSMKNSHGCTACWGSGPCGALSLLRGTRRVDVAQGGD